MANGLHRQLRADFGFGPGSEGKGVRRPTFGRSRYRTVRCKNSRFCCGNTDSNYFHTRTACCPIKSLRSSRDTPARCLFNLQRQTRESTNYSDLLEKTGNTHIDHCYHVALRTACNCNGLFLQNQLIMFRTMFYAIFVFTLRNFVTKFET